MTLEPIAELRHVSKIFPTPAGDVVALDDVDLSVQPRDYIAIMGPSGSGKSTLLNILGGIDRPSTGEVCLGPRRIDGLSERELLDIRRTCVSYVFQEARLIPSLSALENVMLPWAFHRADKRVGRDRAHDLLAQVGLENRAHHMAHQLSGGEGQRVCIARALAINPSLILADEPTGNLDHKTREDIVVLLETLSDGGCSVVMVTHDPEMAARAHRRIAMHDGRLQSDERRH
jgi:putative ABC transport system ATP-binding protein